MITQAVKCDTCKSIINDTGQRWFWKLKLDSAWLWMHKPERPEEFHFCSMKCLHAWSATLLPGSP